MAVSEFTPISLGALDSLFRGKSVGETLVLEDTRCGVCGKSVNIKIQKTSEGYGFLNGIISELVEGQFSVKCYNCNGLSATKGP